MSEDRPLERKRVRRGLDARSAGGENVAAEPQGRMRGAPGRSRNSPAPGPEPQPRGRARLARKGQAQRRTARDNPDAV
jgi:hypothetical protein